jgi:hypothetical protein
MVITKKSLSRRTVLRGLGVSIALPLLDGMIPAFAAGPVRVKRLGAIYVPNGMSMPYWTPKSEGSLELSPVLEPLTRVRNQVVVLSGMSNKDALPLIDEGDGDHSRCQAGYLTGAHAHKASGKSTTLNVGVSMDQIVARHLEKETQLASLELSLESNDLAGQCEDGYGCAYSATIAWRDATTPLPMESNPRAVFEHLFGTSEGTDRAARLRHLRADRSLLDSVTEEIASLRRTLGRGDRRKLAGYFDSIRDIERRIQIAEAQSGLELPEVPRPAGIPAKFEDYANVMLDLWMVAFQADLTRVCTFLFGREKSVRTYPEIGVSDPHHPVSHHGNRPGELERLYKVNKFHMQMFARFVEKLQSTPDGDGSLLDNSVILYGAGMSNSNAHVPKNLPLLLAGGGAGGINGGRHVQLAPDTPMANLHLTLLDKMGVAIERFADSTSGLAVLSEV